MLQNVHHAVQLLLLILLSSTVLSTETDDKFSDLSDARKKELLEEKHLVVDSLSSFGGTDTINKVVLGAYSKSDVLIVHQKLADLRRKWMEKLRSKDAADPQQPRRRVPNLFQLEMLPEEGRPTVFPIHEINRNANLSEFMYQADMVLTVSQAEQLGSNNEDFRAKRQAYRDIFYPNTIWGRTVFYFFDQSATSDVRAALSAAAQFWQQNTCITFTEDSTAPNRIRVFKGDGCYSYVGKIGGQQDLSLGSGCESVGTAAHELGHALGFFHSQSRFDRDSAIDIVVANIQPNFVDQFNKESPATNYNYGMPYDFGSIMQYGATSASRNGRETMLSKDTDYQETMGSDIVAFYDVSMMNEHYNCKVLCPPQTSAQCQNGGYPNPNNCSICNCPSGYGGNLCSERPEGCGQSLVAGPDYTSFVSSVGDGTTRTKINFATCTYWIQAPEGTRIEVRIDSIQGYTVDGCIYGGVEIKAHPDQLRTGYSCNILAFFGYCQSGSVRQRCRRACNDC